jgi:hypothetical protein
MQPLTFRRSTGTLGLGLLLAACSGAVSTPPGRDGGLFDAGLETGSEASLDTGTDAADDTAADTSPGPADSSGDAPSAPDAPAEACLVPPSGIVGWWPADGSFQDLVHGNDGLMIGTVPFVNGEVAQAFSLSGTTNWVSVADAPSLDLTGEITIEAWIDPYVLGGRIVDKITAFAVDGYMLDTYGGYLRLIIGSAALSSTVVIPTGQFSHVAGSYDGATMTVYLNGEPVGSMAGPGSIPINAHPIHFGADQNGQSNFAGIIDEVTLYSRALSGADVRSIFQAGAHGKCKS